MSEIIKNMNDELGMLKLLAQVNDMYTEKFQNSDQEGIHALIYSVKKYCSNNGINIADLDASQYDIFFKAVSDRAKNRLQEINNTEL